jgi:hypothetical protein
MAAFRSSNPMDPSTPRTPRPGGLADRMAKIASQRPPPPKGKGVVLVLVGLAVTYAVIHSFVLGGGSGERLRKEVDAREVKPQVASEGPAEDVPTPSPRETPPLPPSEPEWQVPPGLPDELASSLRRDGIAAAGSDPARARAAVARLPEAVARAPESVRAATRAFVSDRLAEAVARGTARKEALEAAIALQPSQADAGPLLAAVAAYGLADDAAAPSALLFLESFADRGGPQAVAAMDAVVLDGARPLTVRVLAAKARPEGELPEALARLRDDPATPPALAGALR